MDNKKKSVYSPASPPVIVALIYIFMAVITLGSMQGSTGSTLADVAKGFMGSGLVVFFVVGEPLCGVLTGSSFGVLLTVFSAINALSDIPTCIVPFFLKKKYPHACN